MSPRGTVALLIAVLLYAPAPAAAAPVGDCQPGADWPAPMPAPAADVVARVNAHRSGQGLGALVVSPALTAAAEWKARHMARYGYVEHDDPAPPVQRTPFERMQACGYPEVLLGENIAAGYDSGASVMQAGWAREATARTSSIRSTSPSGSGSPARPPAGSTGRRTSDRSRTLPRLHRTAASTAAPASAAAGEPDDRRGVRRRRDAARTALLPPGPGAASGRLPACRLGRPGHGACPAATPWRHRRPRPRAGRAGRAAAAPAARTPRAAARPRDAATAGGRDGGPPPGARALNELSAARPSGRRSGRALIPRSRTAPSGR